MSNGADEIVFADEQPGEILPITGTVHPWKILVVDDEEDVHNITTLVLKDFVFEGKPISLLHAYSAAHSKALLAANPDIAIILLDVVMESDSAGLELVKYIRETLKNHNSRIILRTGQPGKAPENKVIIEYDINEYKNKSELTSQKLLTSVAATLRSYRDLRTIERSRKGLENVISASGRIFEIHSLQKFAAGILDQMVSILNIDEDSLYVEANGIAVASKNGTFHVMAASGSFSNLMDKDLSKEREPELYTSIANAILQEKSIFSGDTFVGYFKTSTGSVHVLYLTGCSRMSEIDKDLVNIFSSNVAIAFDNLHLNDEIIRTQKEVVYTLGEIVENRSKETQQHVRRVGEFCRILAEACGLEETQRDLLIMASPLHDVGKVAIGDSLLKKPGKLDDDEYTEIKNHSSIGFRILKGSNRGIMKTAAIIAHEHHERWDGAGYPRGLKGEEISIFGRICAVADVFDALTHKRVYKPAWEMDKVLAYFTAERGRQFDPRIVDALLQNVAKFVAVNKAFPNEVEGSA